MDALAPGGALLHTKLFAPGRRAEAVTRPRLLARLHAGLTGRLILLAAPPGSGKSAALAEWLAEARAAPASQRFAWLALDEGDNDPPRFWRYVSLALARVNPAVTAAMAPLLNSAQPFHADAAVATLLNVFADAPMDGGGPAVLVLDDYHLIADPAIHRGLTTLIDHLPPQLRLVIASRSDPPLPLARLRVRGELTELRAADLRFTPAEAAVFLRERMGLPLSEEQVAALEDRTEGWAAGLQLAALALREQPDAERFIVAFGGSHRHVLDYLLDEVLHRQPPHLVTFMLQTAILDRLCGPLCDAVLGVGGEGDSYSQLLLDQIERANLLLVPLDAERRWFRYHHLLADVLRHRLGREPAGQRAALHRRAAAWLERNALPEAAIQHWLAAGAPAEAARLVVQLQPLGALARGEAAQVERWLAALPDEVIRAHPTLCLIRARLLLRARQPAEAVGAWLQGAEAGLAAAGEEHQDPGVRAEVAATWAHLAITAGRYSEAAERCAEALAHLPPDDGFGRAALTFMRANALNTFDYAAADRVYAEATALGRAHGNARAVVMSLANRALLAEQRSDLPAAEELLREAIAFAAQGGGRPLPTAQAAYRLLGCVCYERDRLAEAAQHLAVAADLARQSEQVQPLAMTLSALALVRQARGDGAGALATLDEARDVASGAGLAGYGRLVAARRAELQLRQGDLPAAGAWAASFNPGADWRPVSHDGRNNTRPLHQAYARALIALGRAGEALPVIARLAELAGAKQSPARAAEAHILRALALAASGDREEAYDALWSALGAAQPAGSLRAFLDAGAPLQPLLVGALALWRADPGWHQAGMLLQQLVRRSGGAAAPAADTPGAAGSTAAQPLDEPLTAREQEVLRLFAAGLSSGEIAERLIVSVNTVKTQLKSIYGKLDAHSRSEALARARELGFV